MRKSWSLRMLWREVAFLHWAVSPAALAARLPPGLIPDTFDGAAWLTIVPFRMYEVRLRYGGAIAGFAAVDELNLRTYARAGNRSGVWFFSLDASDPIMVRAARAGTSLPYFPAQIATTQNRAGIAYASTRTSRGVPGDFSAAYRPHGPARHAAKGSLDAYLHERYAFLSMHSGRLVAGDIVHPAWEIYDLDVELGTNTLPQLAGLSIDRKPDFATFSPGVDVLAASLVPALARSARQASPSRAERPTGAQSKDAS